MAVSAINQHRNELAKQFIDGSQLNADTKADLDEMLDSSLRTTNGLKPEEKLDAISDNLYQLTRLTCIHIAETPKTASAGAKSQLSVSASSPSWCCGRR